MIISLETAEQNGDGDLDFVPPLAGYSVGVARCLATGTGHTLREVEPQRDVAEFLPDLSIKKLGRRIDQTEVPDQQGWILVKLGSSMYFDLLRTAAWILLVRAATSSASRVVDSTIWSRFLAMSLSVTFAWGVPMGHLFLKNYDPSVTIVGGGLGLRF